MTHFAITGHILLKATSNSEKERERERERGRMSERESE